VQIITTLLLLSSAILGFHVLNYYLNPLFAGADAGVVSDYPGILSYIISVFVATFATLVFGILIPKAIGFKYSEGIGKFSIYFMIFLSKLLKYPVKAVTWTGNFFLKPFKEKTDFSQTRFSEDEIRIILSEGVKTGAIDETEHEIIENIFEFNDLKANEVMVPRTEMVAVELVDNTEEIAKEILKTNHSLIPVYKDSLDNIIGVLHAKDFMRYYVTDRPFNIKSLIRASYFVPETKLISDLLKEMQNRGERLAIVMDEYGGTEGVITIEDILEEIVGDIWDNTKNEVKDYSRLPDGKYYVLGSMGIDDFNETFNIELPVSDEYNTVAGFVADMTGKILNSGETCEHEVLVFELIKKIRQKMVQFRVYSKEGEFGENEEESGKK
jgi:putative hemolysin